jgi:DNA-directed RNA polymerase beta' subunit
VKEVRTVKGLFALADYYKSFVNKHLSGKFGLMRRHLFGTRMPYTFRVVISSNTGPHVYDEIIPPWSATVGVLEDHLISKLVRRRFKLNDAIALIHHSIERYHPLIHELINEIISEGVYNVVDIQDIALYGKPLENINGRSATGISATKTRYPSLTKGSTLQVRIPRVKTDPNDHTFDQPILTVVPLNADFDGDQMTVQLALDTMMQRLMIGFAPHRTIYELSTPRTPSGTIAQPKPLVATTGNWLKHMRAPRAIDPIKAAKMAALAKRS